MGRGLKLLRNFLPVIVGYAGGIYFVVQHFIATRLLDPIIFLLYRDAYAPGWYLTPFIISVAFITFGMLLNLLWLVILVRMGVE